MLELELRNKIMISTWLIMCPGDSEGYSNDIVVDELVVQSNASLEFVI